MIRDLPIKKIKLNTKDRKYFKILEDWVKKIKFHNESSIFRFKNTIPFY